MKKIYKVNDPMGVINLFSGLKSMITSRNSRIWPVIAPMLFVAFGLFGVNESAWGATLTAKVAVGSGKGTATVEIYNGYGQQQSSTSSTNTTVKTITFSMSYINWGKSKFTASASSGYTFKGWYTNSACTSGEQTANPYETSTSRNQARTDQYWAKFTPNEYTVTYDAKGGSVSPGSKKVTFDGTYGSLATPTKTGYTFDGWFTAASGGTQVTSSTKVTTASNHTIYAHWTPNTYKVKFNGNGSTSGSMDDQTFTYDVNQNLNAFANFERVYTVSYNANGGTTATTNETHTEAEYDFVNWNTEADGSGTTYKNQALVTNWATSGTVNLYAQWKSDHVVLPNATKEGGVLDAWYLGEERIGAAGDSYTPTADVELTAHWINKYTPEFGGDDHSMKVGNVLTSAFNLTHTDGPVAHIDPAGIISYDAANNKVTALSEGEATIYFTQAETDTYFEGESDHWTFTVTRVANTLALTSTSASKYVDEEVTGIIQTKNSDATVQTSSSDESIAYYDVTNNKIVIPNNEAKKFTSTTVTIEIWQDETVKYEESGKKTFTLTVNKYPASFTGSDYNLMVDGTQTANYVYTNTSANQPTANSANDFYYTIDNVAFTNSAKNKGANLVTFNPANKQITACNAGTAKITLHQKETRKNTAAEKSFNVAVYKYNSTFANTSKVNVKVEADATAPYTLTYTKPNDAYISSESIAEGTPSLNSGEYYYTLTQTVTATNTAGSSDATKAIAYAAGTKTVTGKNAGTATIHLYQTETYKYNAKDASFDVAVTKNANTIKVKGSANYSSSIYRDSYDNGLTITATNTDYANYPIVVEQTDGEDIATYYANQNAVYSSYKLGTATWSLSQPENYRYEAASGSFSVTVAQQAENTCYVLNASSGSDTQMDDATWSYDGPGAVLSYKIKRLTSVTYGDVTVYGYDANNNKTTLNTHGSTSLPTSYGNPIEVAVNQNIRKIEFYTGTYKNTKYVSDVKVTRKTYLNASDLTVDKKSDNTPVYPGETGVGTLKIDYSLANGGNLKITNDNPSKFSLSQSEISASDCNGGSANITIQYTSATAGTDVAHLVIYNNVYREEVTITGKTVKRMPTVTWSSDAVYFNVDDVLSATNANGLTVTLSSAGNESYVNCDGNTATMLEATDGTITITAHVKHNDIYDDADFTKTITITNKEKQYISWDQDFSRLKTTDGTKSITLNAATSASGLKVRYELAGDKTGLTLTQNGDEWTLTYSATECKNTTIIAKQDGDGEYAPASSVSKTVKVIDPTKVCDASTVLVNSQVSIKAENLWTPASATYNIDIPASLTVSFSRMKTGLLDIYALGLDVVFYSGRNGTGEELLTKSYSADDINKTLSNSTIDLADYIHAKSVKITTNATNGYYIDGVICTHRKYCEISTNSLNFSTHPNTKTAALTLDVSYANYPITVECSNEKFTFTPAGFGDCGEYGTEHISVDYTAGPAEGEDVGYLYIKDNTGVTLKTCTLNVTISKVDQSIKTTNIQNSYLTTDKVTLTAEATSGETDFTYSASPAGVASFNGAEMTFLKSDTIAITVNQAGTNVYNPTSATVENVVVSRATPEIASAPTGTSIAYKQTLSQSTLTGGAADITLRGEAHTGVQGTFAWTNPQQLVTDNAGTHNYSVTFTPKDGDMYAPKEFTIPIEITRATQSITMNNGSVKVAVEGEDAGAADSKIDLDDLIQSQSSEVVDEVERTGSVSYKVISANKDHATIGVGNVFSATAVGTYTIRATKAETDYYAEATADFTVTVGKRVNTLAISGTEFEKYVDEEVTTVLTTKNSDAQVKTSSSSPTIAHYDVDLNKIVIPNSEGEEQLFGNQKTVTIKIWQEATDRFEASGEKTITLTVKKYETTITGSHCVVKVNETDTADYAFSGTVTEKPSSNLSDDFYYTIDEPTYENAALNNGEGLITFNPNTNEIVGLNAGTTKITFFHKETRKYTGTTMIRNVSVVKKENEIANSWNVWQKAMNESASANVSFSTTRGDYQNDPIAIDRVYGEEVAALSGDAEGATITTNTTHGYAIWHVSQAENYEYYAADADLMVTVGVSAPPTCYVYEDYSEHEFSTDILDAEGHFEDPIAINWPIDKIWYKAKRSKWGYNYFAVQYSTDNGTTWSNVSSPDLGEDYDEYSATFPQMTDNKRITHVRFGARTGATLSKWYKDVKISRKTYFNIQDAEQKNISSLPTMMCTIDETSTAEAKFYIDYSTCATEILISSSNPEHFTVSRTRIDVDGDDYLTPKEEITVTYNSAELGTHNAVITIRTEYQTRALSVSGETTKRTPTLEWQTGYTNNPLTLPIGLTTSALHPAARSTSTADVQYMSDNESVVEIIENGYAFRVVGLGDARLTAMVPENDKWKSVSGTRDIHATEKTVQEIVWDQSFPRFMAAGDEIDLDAKVYLRQVSTNTMTYSADRTQYITYSCPVNNILSIEGNKMTILDNYGEVRVTASVSGNGNYEAAVPVTMLINVRQPSTGCETPLVLNKTDVVDMFEVDYDFSDYLNVTTQELISAEILLDPANGKPDKLSFSYGGEVAVLYFNGAIKFEQYVNSQWTAVEGSRVETVKNDWNTLTSLQLDENATALRIIREQGAKGHHKVKDIQVTRKQYLRATEAMVDLGVVKEGQTKNATIGFDYSDIKGDLAAHTINETTNLTIADNGIIDLACGSFGHYELPITFTPSQAGDWTGTVEVYDNIANMSFTVVLTATVAANNEFVFNKEGEWNNGQNWTTNQVPNDANVTIAQNATITTDASVKSISIEEGITVTVKDGVTLNIGNGTPKDQETYGNLHVENGGKVILNGSELRVNDFILDASLAGPTDVEDPYSQQEAKSGQVINLGMIDRRGNVFFDLDFDPSGKISYGWYDFTVPFSVNIAGGISRKNSVDDRVMISGSDFVIKEADEADRANGGKGWRDLSGNVLVPGKLYTITFNYQATLDQNTFRFAWDGNGSLNNGQSYEAQCATGSVADLKGWNGMGNGMMRYGAPSGNYKTQTYSHSTNTYDLVAGPKNYAVGEAFFIQVTGAGEVAWNTAEGPLAAPQRAGRTIEEFLVTLKPENIDFTADALYVSASEEATGEYTIGHDLVKMGNPTASKTARMWTTRGNLRLCDSEMPLVANKASFPLTFYAPKNETFDIVVAQAPADASLYLTYNDRVIWNLSMNPYTIDLTQGTTNGYGLRIVANRQTTTDVENSAFSDQNSAVRKVLIDDHIYIVMPDGRMFDAAGRRVSE